MTSTHPESFATTAFPSSRDTTNPRCAPLVVTVRITVRVAWSISFTCPSVRALI